MPSLEMKFRTDEATSTTSVVVLMHFAKNLHVLLCDKSPVASQMKISGQAPLKLPTLINIKSTADNGCMTIRYLETLFLSFFEMTSSAADEYLNGEEKLISKDGLTACVRSKVIEKIADDVVQEFYQCIQRLCHALCDESNGFLQDEIDSIKAEYQAYLKNYYSPERSLQTFNLVLRSDEITAKPPLSLISMMSSMSALSSLPRVAAAEDNLHYSASK